MTDPLLVVDVQQGFLNQYTHHIPARIAQLIQRDQPDPVLFTRFVNAPEGPYHRFLDWHACVESPETDLAPELAPYAAPERVFVKDGLTGITDELAEELQRQGLERVTIVGIDTDMCVLKVAMDVFDLGIQPQVFIDCCASTAGLQAHLAGLAVLSRNIGAPALLDAGLNGGGIAAPR